MTEKPLHIETITEYNDRFGYETLHPLIGVCDFSRLRPMRHQRYTHGFYSIFLKEVKCGDMIYGRHTYDYQEGTVVAVAPGQVIGIRDNGQDYQPKGLGLLFHPDLIHGTPLGRHIGEYSFFSYESNEALHLSEEERAIFTDCVEKIANELRHSSDRLSKRLITNYLELLLDYCLRFYERQFATRHAANTDVLTRFEVVLNDYFAQKLAMQKGLPTVKYCASELCLSPNYFGDLIKRETGHTAQDYIQHKLISVGKERLLDPTKSIAQVADELGFQYSHHFTRVFKKAVGLTPTEYRKTTA